MHVRWVVLKAERLAEGPNVRFVVTHRDLLPQALDDRYVDRREAEGWIKDRKHACQADRLRCHDCWVNQFRLLLHGAAYWLLDTVRRWLRQVGGPRKSLDTLRLTLLKIGGRACCGPSGTAAPRAQSSRPITLAPARCSPLRE